MKHCLVISSAIALAIFMGCVQFWAAVAGRWNAPIPLMVTLGIYIAAAIVFLFLMIAMITSTKRSVFAWSSVLFALFIVGAAIFAHERAAAIRHSEISNAIDAGLATDCQSVVRDHRDHPELINDGYVRIFPGTPEFDSLPNSIREFDPVYVTIEKFPDLNVGLCKNGWGGFHMGVRVFADPPDVPASLRRQPITPTIYVWVDET